MNNKEDIKALLKNNPKILTEILNENPQQYGVMIAQRFHSGPLPAPEDIKHYEQFIPNFGERTMIMAEKEQNNRQENYNQLFLLKKKELYIQIIGQIIGLIALFTFFILAIKMVLDGHAGYATTLMCTGLVSFAGIFVYSHQKNHSEKSNPTNTHKTND